MIVVSSSYIIYHSHGAIRRCMKPGKEKTHLLSFREGADERQPIFWFEAQETRKMGLVAHASTPGLHTVVFR